MDHGASPGTDDSTTYLNDTVSAHITWHRLVSFFDMYNHLCAQQSDEEDGDSLGVPLNQLEYMEDQRREEELQNEVR